MRIFTQPTNTHRSLHQVRTPAALLSGVTFGALFGLPLTIGDPFMVAILKRTYVIMLCAALSSQLLAVIASTSGLMKIAEDVDSPTLYESPTAFLNSELPLEWVSCIFNFLLGLLLFTAAVCIRTTIHIACPYASKACILLCLGAFTSMVGVLNGSLMHLTGASNIVHLGWIYFKLMLGSGNSLNSIALVFGGAGLFWWVRTILHFLP